MEKLWARQEQNEMPLPWCVVCVSVCVYLQIFRLSNFWIEMLHYYPSHTQQIFYLCILFRFFFLSIFVVGADHGISEYSREFNTKQSTRSKGKLKEEERNAERKRFFRHSASTVWFRVSDVVVAVFLLSLGLSFLSVYLTLFRVDISFHESQFFTSTSHTHRHMFTHSLAHTHTRTHIERERELSTTFLKIYIFCNFFIFTFTFNFTWLFCFFLILFLCAVPYIYMEYSNNNFAARIYIFNSFMCDPHALPSKNFDFDFQYLQFALIWLCSFLPLFESFQFN